MKIARFPLCLGAIGLIAAIIGGFFAPTIFAAGWLAALTWFIGWPLGSMALLLTHALTGGRWGELLRPALTAGTSAIVLVLPLALPLALTATRLYPWLNGAIPAGKGFYLDAPFFVVRSAFYLIAWGGLAMLMLLALGDGDEVRLRRLAPPGLALLGLTVTFAAIDLTMTLDPGFNSSVYGLLTAAGDGLLALSVAVLATALISPLAAEDWPDLGRLLLGLVVFWAYLDFMQLLIVWESDLTAEIPWYLRREQGLWGWIAGLVAIGHFVLPFALLLSGSAKRHRSVVAGTAALLIVMEMSRAWWLVLPSLARRPGWIDAAAILGMAGLGAGWLILRTRPLEERPVAREAAGDV